MSSKTLRYGPVVLQEGACFAMDARGGGELIYTLTQIGSLCCSIARVDVDSIPKAGIHTASIIRALDAGDARPCSLLPR
jgi:starvation-inducible outer membrane lipoprotein